MPDMLDVLPVSRARNETAEKTASYQDLFIDTKDFYKLWKMLCGILCRVTSACLLGTMLL